VSWYIRVVDPPEVEPLTLTELKSHLRVDFNDEDTMLSGYITAARELVESECSRALITQTIELGLDDFPILDDRIRLPRGNLQQIINFTYTDSGQVDHAMTSGTDYILNQYAEPAEVVLPWNQIWPAVVLSTAAPVRIQFTCGYGDDPGTVPVQAKQAMLMLIGDWYTNREDVVIGRTSTVAAKLPNGVDRLLTNLRLRNYTPYCR
jgi:uncharacterized phiE125 gp8 family phage protein